LVDNIEKLKELVNRRSFGSKMKQHIELSSSPPSITKPIPEQPRHFKYESGTETS